jgi:hypothetical protein
MNELNARWSNGNSTGSYPHVPGSIPGLAQFSTLNRFPFIVLVSSVHLDGKDSALSRRQDGFNTHTEYSKWVHSSEVERRPFKPLVLGSIPSVLS